MAPGPACLPHPITRRSNSLPPAAARHRLARQRPKSAGYLAAFASLAHARPEELHGLRPHPDPGALRAAARATARAAASPPAPGRVPAHRGGRPPLLSGLGGCELARGGRRLPPPQGARKWRGLGGLLEALATSSLAAGGCLGSGPPRVRRVALRAPLLLRLQLGPKLGDLSLPALHERLLPLPEGLYDAPLAQQEVVPAPVLAGVPQRALAGGS
mmetsp:Transcript_14788/g.43128  ORF Transcript_14788/g.43128 Transcript_14788/m.43128 type:complete len:215 (-) Transcript_14788:386-1030(-)